MAIPHFGLNVPQIKRTWEESRRAALEFEAMGFDSLWVNDHLYGPASPRIPILEAWSLLAALAALTQRVELGTVVTPAGMRNPVYLGKVIASVDQISGGRIIPGFGAGWMEREFTDFGMPFLPIGQRLAQVRETVQFLKRFWQEDTVSFEGEFVRAADVVCEPKPARMPPILIGGAGERVTQRIAAEQGTIWNNPASRQSELARKCATLRRHCGEIGRDPAAITISQQALVVIAPEAAQVEPMVEKAQQIFHGHMGDPAGPLALTGTPERIRDQIQAHLDLGCTMFIFEFFGRDSREGAALFAKRVLPHFR